MGAINKTDFREYGKAAQKETKEQTAQVKNKENDSEG